MSRALQFTIFFSIVISIVAAIMFFLWFRLVKSPSWPQPWRQVLTYTLIGLAVSVPLALIGGRFVPFSVSKFLVAIPLIWMGTMMLLFVFILSGELLRIGFKGVTLFSGSSEKLLDGGRRLFLQRAFSVSAAVGAFGIAGFGVRRAVGQPKVNRFGVELSRLPEAFSGFRIVQITDLHIGLTLGRSWLEEVVERVNALDPDLIAVTGDLVDGTVSRLWDDVRPILKLHSPHGVFFVTGNHEYYSGAEPWLEALARGGIRVLRNERVSIWRGGEKFYLAGVDDFDAQRVLPHHGPDLPKALAGSDSDHETVLMAHQPRAIDEAAAYDVGLVLSGHTHGGQMWPWNYLVLLQQPYVSGLHRHGERTQIYVSPGTGFWGPPMRVGTESEITEITLSAAL